MAQVCAAAMAGVIEQPIPRRSLLLAHQIHEKGVGQRQHAEQFETHLPVVDPQTLDGHFAFQVAERHLDLPSASVSQHDFPGLFCRGDHLVGQQIPGLLPFAPPDDERQGPIGKVRMGHGEEEHPTFHIAVVNSIPDGTGSQAGFAARNFPRRLLAACGVEQVIVGLPAQDKTCLEAAQGSQPGTATIAAIKDMQEAASPAL